MKTFFSKLNTKKIVAGLFVAAALFSIAPVHSFAQVGGTGILSGADSTTVTNVTGSAAQTLDPVLAPVVDTVKNAAGGALTATFGWIYDASRMVLAVCSYFAFQLATLILGFAGVAFNYAVVYLVFHFSTTLGNSPGMLVAWGVLRDFSNIIFLFGFIFMGVITILDLHSYPVQKTLPKFLIAAVLINFSLLGVSAVIDLSNVFAAAMYNQSMGSQTDCVSGKSAFFIADSSTCNEENALNVGIAGKVIEVSKTSTVLSGGLTWDNTAGFFFSPNTSTATSTDPIQGTMNALMNDKTKFAMTLFLLAMFVITAAIVLIAGTVLLVGRAVTLALLLVASPILIIGMVIPPLKKQADQYWTTLINNAIFAPVFILLVFVSLKVAEGVGNTLGGGNLVDAFMKGDVSLMGSLLTFAIIIGFLIASLIAAKQFSIRFAGMVNKAAAGAIIFAGDSLLSTGTLPGRLIGAGIGAAAGAGARSLKSRPGFATSILGRPVVQGLSAVSDGTKFKVLPKGGLVSQHLGAPLIAALGAGGGGHGGGAGGHGGGAGGHGEEEGDPYLKSLTSADKAKLASIEGSKKSTEAQLKIVNEQIENAKDRGDTAEVARLEGERTKLKEKVTDLEKKKRDLVFTDTQKETYARLERQGGEKAKEYEAGIDQAQKEQKTLEATLPGLDNEIAVLQERIANPDYQGEDQVKDVQRLAELRERAARTRSDIAERAATVLRLQGELTKHNNDSTAKLAKYVTDAAGDYKERRVREYADSQERLANSWVATGLVGTLNPFVNSDEIHAAVTKLRSEGLKSGTERAWDHLKHEIQHASDHAAEKKLDPAVKAAEDRAAAAEARVHALEDAMRTNGGGGGGGGGDHGGGH